MNSEKQAVKDEIAQIEQDMLEPDFWQDKNVAQTKIRRLQELKDTLLGQDKYDRGAATITIFAGVGGDDAEDFTRMLLDMYLRYSEKNGHTINFLYENRNDDGGYRTVTFDVVGKNAYGNLKYESGVHRLVRISPFNSAGKRQTSFAMVEVLPHFEKSDTTVQIGPDEIEVEFTKASGPGGQNVNKRETAVRITHKETGLSVFVSNERSQAQNREKALDMLRGKIFALQKEKDASKIDGASISKTQTAEWGSQIRSYVLHPYKMVKDHRTNTETSNVDAVLAGDLEKFITAMKAMKN